MGRLKRNKKTGDGADKKSDPVTLTEEALHAFRMLREACITAPVLAFADHEKLFLLETDVSKEGLGAVLLQKQADGHYHPVAYGSRALTTEEQNYHSSKSESLTLNWVITVHFKEYLLWEPFIVWTDNNLLTYIMTTPNLDATRHHWVESLTQYTFDIKYQKGWDNTRADVVSRMTTRLDTETVTLVLSGVNMGTAQWAGTYIPPVIEAGDEIDKQTQERAVQTLATWPQVKLHVMNWTAAQREDPVLWITLDWITDQRKGHLKKLFSEHAGSEEGSAVLCSQQKLTLHEGAFYQWHTPMGEIEEIL